VGVVVFAGVVSSGVLLFWKWLPLFVNSVVMFLGVDILRVLLSLGCCYLWCVVIYGVLLFWSADRT